MAVYNINGTRIDESSAVQMSPPSKFNFSAMTEAIEKNTDTSATLNAISDDFGTLMYVGAICVNKKIYSAPNTAENILVYDTETEELYHIGKDLGNFAFKYTGFVVWNGLLYAIPKGVNTMLEINPISDDVRVIDLGTTYPLHPYGDYRDSHHYNGVISDDGYMYLPPAYSSNKLLKIDMNDFSWEELNFTSTNVSTWIGCVKHPTENKIIFLSTKVFRVWDCDTDTYEDIVSTTSRSCYDMVYDPRYNCFIGVYPNHVFALMLDDNSIIDSGWVNYMETGYGITLGVDGKYWHLEGNRAHYFIFNGEEWTTYNMSYVQTTDDVGSGTPTLAGQAIDNEGNIYGIPASGKMTKLTFSDVVQGLPDYIVSSQFYGKY